MVAEPSTYGTVRASLTANALAPTYPARLTMAAAEDDHLLALAFAMRANPGGYALLVAAGVSAAAGMPTAWGVLTDLISRVASLTDDRPDQDLLEWYQHRYGEEPRYETLLERLAPSPIETPAPPPRVLRALRPGRR